MAISLTNTFPFEAGGLSRVFLGDFFNLGADVRGQEAVTPRMLEKPNCVSKSPACRESAETIALIGGDEEEAKRIDGMMSGENLGGGAPVL
jgi:hypothetical protein